MTIHSSDEREPLAAVAERETALGELDALLAAARVGTIRLTTDGEFLAVNDAFTTLTGYSCDELRDRSFTTVLPNGGTMRDDALAWLREAGAEPVTLDHRIETAAGESIACETTVRSVGDPGDGVGLFGVVRTRVPAPAAGPRSTGGAETAIGKSFLALANAISDGIIVLDSNSDIQYANPAVERILGYSPTELVGGSKLKIIPDRLQGTHLAALQRYLDTGERNIDWSYVELPGQHRDGHEVPLGVSLNTFTYGGAATSSVWSGTSPPESGPRRRSRRVSHSRRWPHTSGAVRSGPRPSIPSSTRPSRRSSRGWTRSTPRSWSSLTTVGSCCFVPGSDGSPASWEARRSRRRPTTPRPATPSRNPTPSSSRTSVPRPASAAHRC